jgi:hypothetical protein
VIECDGCGAQGGEERINTMTMERSAAIEQAAEAAIQTWNTRAAQPEQEPTCPECKAAVLYECVACSSNNYPPSAIHTSPANTHHEYTPAEPSQWRDMVVVSLVREGVNKHRARELADHFAEAEREACVAACEGIARKYQQQHYASAETIADECAAAISARSETHDRL